MKLNEIDLMAFIPEFMKNDKDSQAFVYAIQKELIPIISNIKHASIYSRIDELEEEILDILAEQFSIQEYQFAYNINVKRSIIKNCMLIHHQRGTVSSVEKVVSEIFGNAIIEEWFEYGGQPYHFKVRTSNVSASDEMLAQFEKVINSTQNCRSYLEAAIIELYQDMNIYVGATCSIGSIDKFVCNM